MKGKRFIFAKKFDGLPKHSDFELVEEEVPPVKKNGE
jgi:prostaglandin reductase 1